MACAQWASMKATSINIHGYPRSHGIEHSLSSLGLMLGTSTWCWSQEHIKHHQTLPLQTFHTPHRRFFMKGHNSMWNEGSRRTQDMRTRRSSLWNGKALGLGAWDYGICEMIECSRHPRSLLVSEVQGLRTSSSPFCMMLRALFFNPSTIDIIPWRISDIFKQFP